MSCGPCGGTVLGTSSVLPSYVDTIGSTFGAAPIYPTLGSSWTASSAFPATGYTSSFLSSSLPAAFDATFSGIGGVSSAMWQSYPAVETAAATSYPTLPLASSAALLSGLSFGASLDAATYVSAAQPFASAEWMTTSIAPPAPLALPAPVSVSISAPAPLALPAPPTYVSQCCPPALPQPPPKTVPFMQQSIHMHPMYITAQTEIEELREKNISLEKRLLAIEGKHVQTAKLEAELAKFRMQAASDKQRSALIESNRSQWTVQITVLTDKLRTAENRIMTMEAHWNNERMTFQQQLTAFEQRAQVAESQRDEALKQVAFFETQVRTFEARITEMQTAFATERRTFQEQIHTFQVQIQQWEVKYNEAMKMAAHWEMQYRELFVQFQAAQATIVKLEARIRELEIEIRNLLARLNAKPQVTSQTSMKETYKVKSFEIAAKLARSDGTDDGLYNGLPIEVEGEGLYRDLVAKGRKPNPALMGAGSLTGSSAAAGSSTAAAGGSISGGGSITGGSTSSVSGGKTYIVTSMDIAERVSKMNPADDGTYNGLPIEVKGMGLFRDLRRRKL